MATAENILDESAWLFHSDWSEQCKSEARTIETETDGQTAALTGHNPRGDIRPMVKDQVRGEDIMIDSGSVICLEPASPGLRAHGVPDPSTPIRLKSVNGVPLRCYSRTQCTVDLDGLLLTFEFIVAAVSQTIIGSDFLMHFGFAIAYHNTRLTYSP